MTVTYLPPVNLGGGDIAWYGEKHLQEAIMAGPEYVRTSRSGRWHKVRAGKRWIATYDPDRLRESYELWCGQHAGDYQGLMFRDAVPDQEPLCGKCYGAALGADPAVPDLIFLPRRLRRPKVCPGSQKRHYRQDPDHWNRGWCLVCGDHVKLRGFGGPYAGDYGAQRHEPGPGLVKPCPFHGWTELTYPPDGPRCRCGEEGIDL